MPSFLLFGANRTNRLPSFKCEESGSYSDTVHFAQLTDKLAKYKSKMYTDKKRGAKVHNFRVGDVVLIKQKKLRKDMCRFKSKSLVVTAVKGSMISFDDNGKSFSRDASFFKFKTASTSALKSKESVGDFSDFESDSLSSGAAKLPIVQTTTESTVPQTSVVQRRSERVKSKPVWQKDCVLV